MDIGLYAKEVPFVVETFHHVKETDFGHVLTYGSAVTVAPQIGHNAFHALGRWVLRGFRTFVRRAPWMLLEAFCDCVSDVVSEPQGLILVAMAALFFVPVLMVGGALAVLDEVIFG